MRNQVKVLLGLCLVGTIIAVIGASLRTSNVETTENIGVAIHRFGMMVMLLGFGGLFYFRKQSPHRNGRSKFSWLDIDGKLIVRPRVRQEVLDISKRPDQTESSPNFELLELDGVRCLIANGQTIRRSLLLRFVKHQQLLVIDLQGASLDEEAIRELESLESLEILLVAGCIDPIRAKELRMALPEARMIFDARVFSIQLPNPEAQPL